METGPRLYFGVDMERDAGAAVTLRPVVDGVPALKGLFEQP